MRKDNIIRLRHMLEAAKEAISFSENKTKNDLHSDRMLALSIIKSIEIIGEAASTVTKDFRDSHNEIPWASIVSMHQT
ncbi:MAG: HepT-like ribonuclease domain-containing protein [Thermodesulfobacteriota bacterium]